MADDITKVTYLIDAAYKIGSVEANQLQEYVAALPSDEALIVEELFKILANSVRLGTLRARNPGVPLDEYGRLMQCSACKTTENIHRDSGYGGPYRCNSNGCVMF